MTDQNQANDQTWKLGDRVEILGGAGAANLRGRIIELRGPLGPGGSQVYRIRIGRKPKPMYIEVLGDQLKLLAPAPDPAP
jgi:hypothetical protein